MNYFVTGTDTDSGKTCICSALLYKAQRQYGLSTLGIKPIASGCEETDLGLQNADALSLLAQTSVPATYADINPFSFKPAIAPHLAAMDVGVNITPRLLLEKINTTLRFNADFCLIEGAGGWRLPLGNGDYLSAVAQHLSLPVIMVVGMKLGCINHAVLTQEAIKQDGLTIAGWVANRAEANMARFDDNLTTLQHLIDAPLLGVVPHLAAATVDAVAPYLDLTSLLSTS